MNIPFLKKKIIIEKLNDENEVRYDIPLPIWKSHKHFQEFFQPIIGKSLVGEQRFFILYQLVNHTMSIDGDIAEIGVYKGGTAKFLSSLSTKKLHLFDTFFWNARNWSS